MLKIRTTIQNNDEISIENYTAIKNQNKIIYNEKEYKITIYLEDSTKIIRENDDYLFSLEFISDKQTRGTCLLKENNSIVDLDILTDYVIIQDDLIIIKYKVLTTQQDVIFKLEVLKWL